MKYQFEIKILWSHSSLVWKNFLYRTEQVKYDSDLSIEVLRHVLLEYEQENGVFPQLYSSNLTMDQTEK